MLVFRFFSSKSDWMTSARRSARTNPLRTALPGPGQRSQRTREGVSCPPHRRLTSRRRFPLHSRRRPGHPLAFILERFYLMSRGDASCDASARLRSYPVILPCNKGSVRRRPLGVARHSAASSRSPAAATRPTPHREGTRVHAYQHDSTSPRAARAARKGISGVPRS